MLDTQTAPRPPAESRRTAWSERLEKLSLGEAGIYYALAVAWVVLVFVTMAVGAPSFLGPGNIANILYQASFIAIIAVPMTLVLVSGNFDLSVGATAAMCAAVVLLLSDVIGIYPAIFVSLAIGAIIGLVNALIVQFVGINAFIVTLAMMTTLRGLLLIVTGGHTASANDRSLLGPLKAIENGTWVTPNLMIAGAVAALIAAAWFWRSDRGRRVRFAAALAAAVLLCAAGFFFDASWRLAKPVYYMAAVTLLAWIVTEFTIVGRRLQAVGANAEAARLIGVSIGRYKVVPFVLNGLAAAFVGLLFAARLGAVLPNAMSGLELTVITAAILGGTSLFGGSGSVLKSVAGSVLLFSLVNGFDVVGLGSSYQGVISGVVLVIAAAIYTVGKRAR
jgi:D-xylose transport system permease protein